MAKLSIEIISQIPVLYALLGTQKKVAESLGISTSSVSKYLKLAEENKNKIDEKSIDWKSFKQRKIESLEKFLEVCGSELNENCGDKIKYDVCENEDYFFLSADGDINLTNGSFIRVIPYILGLEQNEWKEFAAQNGIELTTPNCAPKFKNKLNAFNLVKILDKNINIERGIIC